MKKYIAIGLVSVMMLSMIGCTTDKVSANDKDTSDLAVTYKTDNGVSNEDEYSWVGEIMEFAVDGVHIISGDMVDIFDIDEENAKKFYIGETVGVKEIDGKLILEPIKVGDFNVKHTNMGELIQSNKGTLIDVSKEKIVIRTDDGDVTYKSYIETEMAKGTNVTVDYLVRDGENFAINLYNEDYILDLEIKAINRAENTGIMIIDTVDKDDLEYTVYVTLSADLNFNLSELAIGDKIRVYPELIRESYPAQVDPQKIIKM